MTVVGLIAILLADGIELEINGKEFFPGDPFEMIFNEHLFDEILHLARNRIDLFVELQFLVL